jgi:hypothetical protein
MPWLFEMVWSLFALVHQQQSINWWEEHMNQKNRFYVQVCKVILARQILQNSCISMFSWLYTHLKPPTAPCLSIDPALHSPADSLRWLMQWLRSVGGPARSHLEHGRPGIKHLNPINMVSLCVWFGGHMWAYPGKKKYWAQKNGNETC